MSTVCILYGSIRFVCNIFTISLNAFIKMKMLHWKVKSTWRDFTKGVKVKIQAKHIKSEQMPFICSCQAEIAQKRAAIENTFDLCWTHKRRNIQFLGIVSLLCTRHKTFPTEKTTNEHPKTKQHEQRLQKSIRRWCLACKMAIFNVHVEFISVCLCERMCSRFD